MPRLRLPLFVQSLEERLTPAAQPYLLNHLLPEGLIGAANTPITPGLVRILADPQTIEGLRTMPGVTAISVDAPISVERVPNDAQVVQQWALTNIEAPSAWDLATGTRKTIVAVVDSGIDPRHPDLVNNLWVNRNEIAGNGFDDDQNGIADDIYGANFINTNGDVTDSNGHGTHVAGIIGAVGNNAIGVSGINWTTQIMSLKFIGANGGYTSDAIRAIQYAVKMGANIINASWGGPTEDANLRRAMDD
ncbi:MAG: S8 family serine peptidase, partial [Gemmataceae bacterium]